MKQRTKSLLIQLAIPAVFVMVSIGFVFGFVFRFARESSPESLRSASSVAGAAADAPRNFCDVLSELSKVDSSFAESSLYVRFVTPHYVVLLNVLPRECVAGEQHCSWCSAASMGPKTEDDGADGSFMDICTGYEGLELFVRHGGVPEDRREEAVRIFITTIAARIVTEVSGERICHIEQRFDLEQMFPLEVTVPAAPPGATSI